MKIVRPIVSKVVGAYCLLIAACMFPTLITVFLIYVSARTRISDANIRYHSLNTEPCRA